MFLAIFLGLSGVLFVAGSLGDTRLNEQTLDFGSLEPEQRAVFVGFGTTQPMHLKLSYLEGGPRYRIGFFADHTGAMFSRNALPSELRSSFFNYYMMFTSLPEIEDIIGYAAKHDMLPSDVVIVMVDNPHVGNGLLNYERRSNLAHKMFSTWSNGSNLDRSRMLARWYRMAVNRVAKTLDWRSAWTNLAAPVRKMVVIRADECADYLASRRGPAETSGWIGRLPASLRTYVALTRVHDDRSLRTTLCDTGMPAGLGHDGSERGRQNPEVLDRHEWPDTNALEPRHAAFIVEQIDNIHRTAQAAGRTAIFVIPPVYGGSRDVQVHRIFSEALKRVSRGVRIIDHRFGFQERKYYHGDDEHTGIHYYEALVEEMIRRGWLDRALTGSVAK